MAKRVLRPRMLGLSKLLIFGIPLAGLILFAVSWLGQEDLSDLAQAEGRISACDIGKTSSRFRGDTVFFEILLDSPEPNHFGFSKPDAYFDDVYRLCLEKPRVRIKYVQDESKFYSEIGNWIVALASVDSNEDIFTLQDYEDFLAESGFPWLYLGIAGGLLWLISLLYLYQNHRHQIRRGRT